MSFFNLLYTVLIKPLQLVFEIIFVVANRFIGNPGLAIIALSLAMNLLVLPLYRRADAMQEEARDMDNKLRRGVYHIKKTFSGDEKMMVLQTYYRQNDYRPTDALKGSVSLLLEIPFFIAAYQFLSHLKDLEGISFGPIADLASPDALLSIAGISVNVLPFLMTAINLVSSAIFLKGFPLKSKIQLYGMALFFLVFLYNSPAGLVFYWTLNNLFSLVKTIFYKIKNPRKVLTMLASIAGIAIIAYAVTALDSYYAKRKAFIILAGIAMQAPLLAALLKKFFGLAPASRTPAADKPMFFLCAAFMAVLSGLLIPSTVIASSPLDFVDINYLHNPLLYVLVSGCLAFGSFVVWFYIFYGLASAKGKVFFERAMAVLAFAMLINYMFFGTDHGVLSPDLKYEKLMFNYSLEEQLINIAVLLLVSIAVILIAKKRAGVMKGVVLTALIAMLGMSVWNCGKIASDYANVKKDTSLLLENDPQFSLSKDGKNVVVLMLDRAMGEYIPYLLAEKPELAEKFDGFTYYPNTMSYAGITAYAAPALFGGYEYTPVEMNKRADEKLVDKHNEALKVMPVLFDANGYDVTVCDAPFANYREIPDLSIYDDYPGINTYLTDGKFTDPELSAAIIENNYRNFFCFSIMKGLPLFLQDTMYLSGNYNQALNSYDRQLVQSKAIATGTEKEFMDAYNVLDNLPEISNITDSGDSFLMMTNLTTHSPVILQMPDYEPLLSVDNRAYDSEDPYTLNIDGRELHMDNYGQTSHYHVNMAALMKLAEWFDYMRENGVYDNTRIILVSDHGYDLWQMSDLIFVENENSAWDLECFAPLLMVKDFDSSGFTVDNSFMTNADVPTLATEDIIEEPVNPFTGKEISGAGKNTDNHYILTGTDFQLAELSSNTFLAGTWFSVSEDIWNKDNWSIYPETTAMPAG